MHFQQSFTMFYKAWYIRFKFHNFVYGCVIRLVTKERKIDRNRSLIIRDITMENIAYVVNSKLFAIAFRYNT